MFFARLRKVCGKRAEILQKARFRRAIRAKEDSEMAVNKNKLSTILCFTVSIVWGMGFVFLKWANDSGLGSSPSFINLLRFGIAALAYGIFYFKKIRITKETIKYCIPAGVLLFTAFMSLTIAQKDADASICAFLNSLSTVIIPFLSWAIFKRKPSAFIVVSVILYTVGALILSGALTHFDNFQPAALWAIVAAIAFALHYMVISKALQKIDTHSINFTQFATVALLSLIGFAAFDHNVDFVVVDWGKAMISLVCMGILNTIYAYAVQTYSQQYLYDYQISLILALENVWAVFFSVILGEESFKWETVLGGAIIMAAILFADVIPSWVEKKTQLKKASAPSDNDT